MDSIGGTDIFSDLKINDEAKELLQTTAKWGRISALVSLVTTGISIAAMVYASVEGSGGNANLIGYALGKTLLLTIPFLAIIITLCILMLRFSTSFGGAVNSTRQDLFNQAAVFLKNYFKMLGIVIIIGIGLFIIALIGFGLGSSF